MEATTSSAPDGHNQKSPAAAPEVDEFYYLTPVVIQVEDRLFKLPRYPFIKNSVIFRDMFSVPPGSDQEGSSDKSPVKLEHVNKDDFRRLLEVLFPLTIPPVFNMPKDSWAGVLKLATMWEISNVRTIAIEKLTALNLNTFEKIGLGKDHHVPQWLRAGYQELVTRSETITHEEVGKMGGWIHYPSEISGVIERLFKGEIDEATAQYNTYASQAPT